MRRALAILVLLLPSASLAKGLQLELFEARPAGSGILGVPTSRTLPSLGWSVDAWATYSRDPLLLQAQLEDDSRGELVAVADRLSVELVGAFAPLGGVELFVAMPVGVGFSEGDAAVGGRSASELSDPALGDLRLGLDLDVLGLLRGRRSTVGVTLGVLVYAPTGDPVGFHGEEAFRFEPHLGVDVLAGALRVAADVAYQVRPESRVFNFVNDDTLRWKAGLEAGLGGGLAALASVQGVHHVVAEQPDPKDLRETTSDAPYDAIDGLLGLRFRSASGADVTLAGGRGINSGLGTPSLRLLLRIGYGSTPERGVRDDGAPPDEDGDGIPDDRDICPNEPEIHDGRRDEDGCPELPAAPVQAVDPEAKPVAIRVGPPGDADGDGLRDDRDGCPEEAEDVDGFADQDGCPDPDNDGDSVPDAADKCPLVAGAPEAQGCARPGPDSDGDGITDAVDVCPQEPETVNDIRDGDGCPEDPVVIEAELPPPPQRPATVPADPDGDGLVGLDDACPRAAEDVDGFMDGDGCPEPDNDGDGLLDKDDKCPLVAETFDGHEDEDGCPDVGPDTDGDGLADAFDQCPNEAETVNDVRDADGCPEDPVVLAREVEAPLPAPPRRPASAPAGSDPDDDDLVGDADECPHEAEDPDGFADGDGCPDLDNDGDGIPDLDDECPDVAEVLNHLDDEDGCPDYVAKADKAIVGVARGLAFKLASARIQRRSKRVLAKVLRKLKGDSRLRLLIAGHTDNSGTRKRNRELSTLRAYAVRKWLIRRGIAPDRLEAVGVGPDQPIASNGTRAGRKKNRRVELRYTTEKAQ